MSLNSFLLYLFIKIDLVAVTTLLQLRLVSDLVSYITRLSKLYYFIHGMLET
jgi:hypothetical protein